jgi:hypothetical protein
MDPEPLPDLVHRVQQDKPKQLGATSEFCATRGAYETTGVLTAKKKSDERLRKMFKEYTTLDDEEIEQELQEEDSTEYQRLSGEE